MNLEYSFYRVLNNITGECMILKLLASSDSDMQMSISILIGALYSSKDLSNEFCFEKFNPA